MLNQVITPILPQTLNTEYQKRLEITHQAYRDWFQQTSKTFQYILNDIKEYGQNSVLRLKNFL